MKLSVLMPVFNERNLIEEIISRVLGVELNVEMELVIVDDASTDGTVAILQGLTDSRIKILYHERNRGKGAALRTGLPACSGDWILIQDADLEYDPRDYSRLLEPIREGRTQVVYGSRFTGQRPSLSLTHWLGNLFLTLTTNILYRTTLSDMETCYKLWRADIIQGLNLKSNRFEFEPEVTAKVLKNGWTIQEVPISYVGRKRSEGKKITWRDGLTALWTLVKYRFVD